jgi:hypothetical protein
VLLCVCYRENDDGTGRLTTVDLVVEREVIQKRDDSVVAFKIKPAELELRRLAQAKGANDDGKNFMGKLALSEGLRMCPKTRIAVRPAGRYQKRVPTRRDLFLPVKLHNASDNKVGSQKKCFSMLTGSSVGRSVCYMVGSTGHAVAKNLMVLN